MRNAIFGLVALLVTGCGNPTGPAPTPTSAATTSATPAATGPRVGDAAKGKAVYEGTCLACHGADGHGVTNLGKPLVGSAMLGLKDEDLVAFIIQGRDAKDTANTTGVAMPPRGGNPALSDEELLDSVAYIRSLK